MYIEDYLVIWKKKLLKMYFPPTILAPKERRRTEKCKIPPTNQYKKEEGTNHEATSFWWCKPRSAPSSSPLLHLNHLQFSMMAMMRTMKQHRFLPRRNLPFSVTTTKRRRFGRRNQRSSSPTSGELRTQIGTTPFFFPLILLHLGFDYCYLMFRVSRFSRGSVWLLRNCGKVEEIVGTQHHRFDS